MRNCDWCGKEHPISVGSPTTCSDECKRLLKNKKWNEWSKARRKDVEKVTNADRMYNIDEVAIMAGCPSAALKRLAKRGDIPNRDINFCGQWQWNSANASKIVDKLKPLKHGKEVIWTKETVLEEIRKYGDDPASTSVPKKLVTATQRYFDSWSNAKLVAKENKKTPT